MLRVTPKNDINLSNQLTGSSRPGNVIKTNHGIINLRRFFSTALMTRRTTSSGLRIGNNQENRVFTPSNIPVFTKNGHTTVVITLLPSSFSSTLSASSKPTAADLLAQ